MTVTRRELQEYNKSDKSKSLIDFVNESRNVIDVKVQQPKAAAPKTERQEVIDKLEEKGIEFKKNSKTSDLKTLLEESN